MSWSESEDLSSSSKMAIMAMGPLKGQLADLLGIVLKFIKTIVLNV